MSSTGNRDLSFTSRPDTRFLAAEPKVDIWTKMSLRAKSHADLTAARASSDGGLRRSFSTSSSNVTGVGRLGGGTAEEVKGPSRLTRRPVRAVRPLSAVSANGPFLQINHLQGELVRKRKVRRGGLCHRCTGIQCH